MLPVRPRVVILGGGIAGLSAAHELIERGFEVEVYESLAIAGGKARSIPLLGTGTNGRRDLPGEHGFRFFPRFYRHVIDTMRRIPYGVSGNVAENLVDTSRCQLARFGRHPLEVSTRAARTIGDVRVGLDDLGRFLGGDLGLSHAELALFASKIWQVATSCRERRMDEYEKIGWWEFIEAETQSPAYQKLLGHGFTRSLIAAKANAASTKTVGDMCVQVMFDMVTPGPSTDRVLNGPTNDVWINPWLEYLTAKGVQYHLNSKVQAVTFEGGRVRDATVERGGSNVKVEGDYFVFAMPVEDVIDLVTPAMVEADPMLGHLFTLDDITEWMNGIQIYLTEDVPISHGHTIYVDSPWALTSISQAQFWKSVDLGAYGDGTVKGIISVDISEWEQKGLNGKAAKECTREEIKVEVWEQLRRSLQYGDVAILRDEQLHHWALDPAIEWSKDGRTANEEPLLVNLVDTWKLRPEAVTRIPNLVLASDYVRTYTDLATMEAANEAARRAVNGILEASGSNAPRCGVWPLHEPEIFAPWRALDLIRYRQGLPWEGTLVNVALRFGQLMDTAIIALERDSEKHTSLLETGAVLEQRDDFVTERESGAGGSVTADLRRDAMALVERLVGIVAQRLARNEANRGSDAKPAGAAASRVADGSSGLSAGRARRGKVQILPR